MRSVLAMLLIFELTSSGRSETIIFPADAGIVDVTKAPYLAKGDGRTDDTKAIQKALDDHPNQGAIIYLPKGTYLISETLKWPHGNRGGLEEKNTILQGETKDLTTIKLKDDAKGFTDPAKPKAMVWTGQKPAQRFRNAIRNLTFHTGVGNRGAIGLQFMANNQGGIFDVHVRAGDSGGPIGIDMGYTDEIGPLLVKNVHVNGFDIGIRCGFSVNSMTFENIELTAQNKLCFSNQGQCVSIRKLKTLSAVPAIFNGKVGLMTLIDSELLTSVGDKLTGINNESNLFVRSTRIAGYQKAISSTSKEGSKEVPSGEVKEWCSREVLSLFESSKKSLNLKIETTPEIPWGELSDWTSPLQHGIAVTDGSVDATEALQKAIDSGKSTVYLPRGRWMLSDTIQIRGKVKRLIGCEASIVLDKGWKTKTDPVFKVVDGDSPVVLIERIRGGYENGPFNRIEHVSKRTLVLKNMSMGQGQNSYVGTGGGKLFIEDCVGGEWRFKDQTVYARQLNVENEGTHIVNDGGSLWILGDKTERAGTLIETKNKGRTELLGGFCYSTGREKTEPMFTLHDSQGSFIIGEASFNKNPFQELVKETRGTETKILKRGDAPGRLNGSALPLFVSGE
jgi:hypothetical protein